MDAAQHAGLSRAWGRPHLALIASLLLSGCGEPAFLAAPWSADSWVVMVAQESSRRVIRLYGPGEPPQAETSLEWAEFSEYPELLGPDGSAPDQCGLQEGGAGPALPPANGVWRFEPDQALAPIKSASVLVSWACAANPCGVFDVEVIELETQPTTLTAVDAKTVYLAARTAGSPEPTITRVTDLVFDDLPTSTSGVGRLAAVTWNHHDELWGVGLFPTVRVVRFDLEGRALEVTPAELGGDRGADADASPAGDVLISGSTRLVFFARGSTIARDLPVERPSRVSFAGSSRAFVLDEAERIHVWDSVTLSIAAEQSSFLLETDLQDLDADEHRAVAMDHFGAIFERAAGGWEKLPGSLPPLESRYRRLSLLPGGGLVLAAAHGLVARTAQGDWCVLQEGWEHYALDAAEGAAYGLALDTRDSKAKLMRITWRL